MFTFSALYMLLATEMLLTLYFLDLLLNGLLQ